MKSAMVLGKSRAVVFGRYGDLKAYFCPFSLCDGTHL